MSFALQEAIKLFHQEVSQEADAVARSEPPPYDGGMDEEDEDDGEFLPDAHDDE